MSRSYTEALSTRSGERNASGGAWARQKNAPSAFPEMRICNKRGAMNAPCTKVTACLVAGRHHRSITSFPYAISLPQLPLGYFSPSRTV